MQEPGIYNLGDVSLTSAGTQTMDPVIDLDGMLAVSIYAKLAYGSGGTTAKAYVQTSISQGLDWIDIACITFGTAGATKVVNLSGLTPKTAEITPADGGLADDTVVDGVLGDRLRLKVVSTGTYAGSSVLSVRAAVR